MYEVTVNKGYVPLGAFGHVRVDVIKELKCKVKGLGPAVLHVYRNQTFTLKSTGERRKGVLCTSEPPVLQQQDQLSTEWVTPDIGEIAGDGSLCMVKGRSKSRSRSEKRSTIRRRSKSRSRSKSQQDPRPCLSVVKRKETGRLGLLLSQKNGATFLRQCSRV